MKEAFKTVLNDTLAAAGKLIQDRFQTTFSIKQKSGLNNLVTEVDEAVEQLIRDKVLTAFPDHAFLGEESAAVAGTGGYQWIVDPIDGTTNFARGIPLCCVSIALAKDNELLLGGVYNPMMNELFFAEKGQGAFLNGRAIHVSACTELDRACLVTGFPYRFPEGKDITAVFAELVKRGLPVRRLGSAAMDLCWVACGRFDGFWEYNLQPWDIAAGYLIVAEAGGKVSDFSGRPGRPSDKETLATNGHIHEALRGTIGKIMQQPDRLDS